MARTFTWIGTSAAPGTIAADWTPSGGPPAAGDTEIIGLNGTVLEGDGLLSGNTVILDGGRMTFAGDTLVSYASPSLDGATLITTATAPNSASASTIDALGNFVNKGTILAAGATGGTLVINVGTTIINGLAAPGYFFNPGTIEANAGNTVTINVGPTAELFNTGTIAANGGVVRILADPAAIASGYAPVLGLAVIQSGGTLETNATFPSIVSNGTTAVAATGVTTNYEFADTAAGDTLKIDNAGGFSGRILNFQAGDTIDLGASLAVASVVYSSTTGILSLDNGAGTAVAALAMGDGGYQSGTFAVSGGTAGSFKLGTAADGDTALLTSATIPAWNASSGTWQNASDWSGSQVPGTIDTPLIGQSATAPFVLTTGTAAVQVGGFMLDSTDATLRIITNTTATPNTIGDLAGTLEVTGGTTLTGTALRLFTNQAVVNVDANATFALLGHPNLNLAAIGGALSLAQGNTVAATVGGGQVTISGSLLAGPSAGGNGGGVLIGEDGSGLPAGVTVNAGGKVTDTFALLGSDPTGAGSVTLNGGGASWTDEIDTNDPTDSRGDMIVGFNNVSTDTPTGFAAPPAVLAAQLLVENGATLADQRGGFIGESADSTGNVTISAGGFWNLAVNGVGQLGVGDAGVGTLSVLNGGSVAVGNVGTFLSNGTTFTAGGIGIGISAGASGTITVSGTGSQLSTSNGINVGRAGQGALTVLNGGSVLVNLGGVNVGTTAGATASGTITIGGSGAAAALSFGASAAGMGIGDGASGTVNVLAGGTINMNGTRGIGLGQAAGASGTLTVSGGVINEGPTSTGLGVGQAAGASGLVEVMNVGTITVGGGDIGIGTTASSASGTIAVSGANSVIRTTGTAAIVVGSAGQGLLSVSNGGSVSDNNGLFLGTTAGAVGTVAIAGAIVNAASISIDSAPSQAAAGLLTLGPSGVLTLTGGANVNKNGYATLTGGTLNVGPSGVLNVAAGGELDGFGKVNAGTLNNAGTIVAAGGALSLSNGVGSMAIASGATLSLSGSLAGGVVFNGGSGTLVLNPDVANSGTVYGFGVGDTIVYPGLPASSSVFLEPNNVLTVGSGDGATQSVQLDPAQSFAGATFGIVVSGGTAEVTEVGAFAAAPINAVYSGVLRTAPPSGVLAQTESAIASGQESFTQFENGLLSSEQALYTTLPALVTIDAYYNATPSASTLNAVAAAPGSPSQIGGFYSAEYLHSLGYSDPNVWTIMASQWGADQTSAFYQLYNSYGTNYGAFISAVYQREFGFAPSASNLQTLVGDVPGVQALLAGGGGAATPIQVVSGIYGYLLYVGQTTPSLPTQYATSANAFLQAAANGTANYGQELTQQFPTASTGGAARALADPNVITVTSSDQLIDPGTGSFSIQFQAGAGADTVMLHGGGVDEISGFDPATDALDVRALLAGTGLALSGDIASLAGYLTVTDQGGDALVRFDPTGQAGGATVAVLQGLGDSVTGLASLIAHGAVRIT